MGMMGRRRCSGCGSRCRCWQRGGSVADRIDDQARAGLGGEVEVDVLDGRDAHLRRDPGDGRVDRPVEVPAQHPIDGMIREHRREPVETDEPCPVHPADAGREWRMVHRGIASGAISSPCRPRVVTGRRDELGWHPSAGAWRGAGLVEVRRFPEGFRGDAVGSRIALARYIVVGGCSRVAKVSSARPRTRWSTLVLAAIATSHLAAICGYRRRSGSEFVEFHPTLRSEEPSPLSVKSSNSSMNSAPSSSASMTATIAPSPNVTATAAPTTPAPTNPDAHQQLPHFTPRGIQTPPSPA